MKCIAIDDEPVALTIIAQYCQRIGGIELQAYSDPMVGLSHVKRVVPDILFLDIEMGEVNGIDLAHNLPQGTFLVFTTAYAQYAVDGFDLNAVDFLHKPFSYSRFCRAVEKAKQLRALQNLAVNPVLTSEEITVKVEYKNVKVRLADVLYVEAMDNYIKIFLIDSHPVLSQMSLKSIQAMLPDDFLRVHKSFIVPLHRIASYTRAAITLYSSGISIPVGRTYYDDLLQKMRKT